MRFNLITILGCTATGKTKLAAILANKFEGEIISADSRQVYKGMDIGTGKDLADYKIADKIIPYHLIDVIEPQDEFNLFLFQILFNKSYNEITFRNKVPFLVGGTGLYLASILHNYTFAKADFENEEYKRLSLLNTEVLSNKLLMINPHLHNTTDLLDRERIIKAIIINKAKQETKFEPEINSLVIGVMLPREEVKSRITKRLKQRLKDGMIEEVKKLIDSGVSYEKMVFFGLEYKFISRYLQGKLNFNDMYQKLNSSIYNFAKKQMTWFKKMEKEGIKIHWISGPDIDHASKIISNYYFKIK